MGLALSLLYVVIKNPMIHAQAPTENATVRWTSVGMRRYVLGAVLFGALSVFASSAFADDTGSTPTPTPSAVNTTLPPVPATAKGLGYTDAATVSYAFGGALVRTGVTLFVLAPSPDEQENHALRVAARVASGGGCLQLEGVW